MWGKLVLVLGCVLASPVLGQWSCTQDSQCADVAGSVCTAGVCACPPGQQNLGSRCFDLAPYHTSVCAEDHQCSRLFTSFECRKEADELDGECRCQEGSHYFLGRCWRTAGYGAVCTEDEECLDVPVDPYSLRCNGTCVCAEGYYERQRGECRKIGYAVGDGCVLNEDCQFANALCELNSLTCQLNTETRISSNSTKTLKIAASLALVKSSRANVTSSVLTSARATRQHGSACSIMVPCAAPFECSQFASCVCPVGYYASPDGTSCLAELGSVSTEAQCDGFLAEVIDGVCSCPPNFYYEDNMRDCIKVTRRITDACVTDENCYTFGAASYCGPPQDPFQMRTCACDAEQAVWDASREMCRLFAGVGEECVVDSDCLAGELEIQCEVDSTGQGYCVCPQGFLSVDGLCLTTGLGIGDACQASQECTETENSACIAGYCACGDGYQLLGDDFCAPIIGGTCSLDSDCVVENTVCFNDTNVFTCQCGEGYIAHEDTCWPVSTGFEASCNITAQCSAVLGENGECVDERCICQTSYHFRDDQCDHLKSGESATDWAKICHTSRRKCQKYAFVETSIFESCSRTSECFLLGMSERVVCRNSLCQCDFDYPYSEELHTCVSSATNLFGSAALITALLYLVLS